MRFWENTKVKAVKKVRPDDDGGEQESGTETREGWFLFLVHSLIALVIFAIGRFVWWLGFAFFVIFAAHILSRLVFVGLLVIFEGWIMWIVVRFVRARGLNPANFDDVLQNSKKLAWINFLMGSIEIYLVVITIWLGLSFFW